MTRRIATPSYTKEILEKHNMYAKKNYGQNFLVEPSIVDKIAREAVVSDNTLAIEIGPGIGALTQCLCEYAKKVVAYEIDERLPSVLEDTLREYDNYEVRLQDFLEIDLEEVCKEFGDYDIVVAANLPYYITTPILFKIFESNADIKAITVMMQKEVGDRFAAKPNTKDYNALSIITQYMCKVEQVMKVPRLVFNPKPNIDSSVLRFTMLRNERVENRQDFFAMVKACFVQRRKTMLNNYSLFVGDKETARLYLEKADIAENRRGESVTLDEFIKLYEVSHEAESTSEN